MANATTTEHRERVAELRARIDELAAVVAAARQAAANAGTAGTEAKPAS